MKRLLTLVPAILIAALLSGSASADFESDVNYLELMRSAAVSGDYEAGYAAQEARNFKIDEEGLDFVKIAFDDLMLLSKIIYAEAGSSWLSIEWKMCVGEVVLNRVASSEFPNTISEVLAQPGQYYGANSRYFNKLLPNADSVTAAIRLLNGERLMDPSVVFQANFKQGSGTHTACYDKYLGWTYFCFSSRPELYAVSETAALTELTVPESTPVEETDIFEPVTDEQPELILDDIVATDDNLDPDLSPAA